MTVVVSIAGEEIPSGELELYPLYSPVIDAVCSAVRMRVRGD